MRRRTPTAVAIALCACLGTLAAERLQSDTGFCLDLPEGYAFAAPVADGKYQFVDATGQAFLSVVAYEGSRFKGPAAMRDGVSRQLGARMALSALSFQGRDALFGSFSFSQSGTAYSGYALCLDGKADERDFLALSYSAASAFQPYRDFLASAIDSFSPDAAGLRLPGIVSWSQAPLDSGADSLASLSYGGKSLGFPVGKGWAAASQAFIEREARVLAAYGDEPGMWREAWKRYYRAIYRDSYRRLDGMAFVLGIEIEKRAREGSSVAAEGLAGSRPPDREYVEAVLSWVQGFRFTRLGTDSDLMNPIDCALKADGDCDARALLMAILLHHWNIDAGMAVSHEHAHAVALVDLPGAPGFNAGIEADGKRYLVAETTATVKPGLIDEAQSDPAAWIGIKFPL